MDDSPPQLVSSTETTSTHSEREFTSLLIYLYRDCPELWKVKSKDYFNRNKRSAAFEKMLGILKTLKPDYTVIKLKQKINSLRTNFNRKHKAIEERRVSADEVSLWYYNDLAFIKDQIEITPAETLEPLLSDDSQSLPSTSLTTPPSSTRTAHPNPKKRKGQIDPTECFVGLASEYFHRPEAEEDILAKGWAMKLKRLDPDQRLFAEKMINDVLFEAKLGTLTREGVSLVEHPCWLPSPPLSSS